MKIGPCKKETVMQIEGLLLFAVIFGFMFYQMIAHPITQDVNSHAADYTKVDAYLFALMLFTFVVCEATIFCAMVYYGRTITLDAEGCCFSFRSFEKKFPWEELDVQHCENEDVRISNRYQANGPGILINVKGRKYNPKWAAMTYCDTFHPMTSVFLRFRGPKDDLKSWKFNHTIVGYTIKREELLAVLEELGQCPEVPKA